MCAYAYFLCVHVTSMHACALCICEWVCMPMCVELWHVCAHVCMHVVGGPQAALEDPESPPDHLLSSSSGSLTVCTHYLMTPILQVRKLG